MATLAPGLDALRSEFNSIAPGRDKSSDGWIGDAAHQASSSDHNPDDTKGSSTPQTDSDSQADVRAIDVDASGPWPSGASFDDIVNFIVKRHRDGADNRLQNVIWNRRIASRSWNWTWDDYTGSNAHTQHAHFSIRPEPYEDDRSPWGLVDKWGDELPMDQASFNKLMDGWASTSNGRAALERAATADVVQRYDAEGQPLPETDPNPKMGINSGIGYNSRDISTAIRKIDALQESVDALAPPPATAAKSTTARASK